MNNLKTYQVINQDNKVMTEIQSSNRWNAFEMASVFCEMPTLRRIETIKQ